MVTVFAVDVVRLPCPSEPLFTILSDEQLTAHCAASALPVKSPLRNIFWKIFPTFHRSNIMAVYQVSKPDKHVI